MGIGGVVVRALRYQLGDLSLSPRPTPCLACRVNISAEESKAAGCVVGRIAHLARHANSSQQPAWFCTVFVWRALEAVWAGSAVGSGARPRCPLTNVCITLTLACGRAAPCHASAFPPVTNPYGRTVPPAVAAAARLGSAGVQAASLGCPREAGRPAFYSEKGTGVRFFLFLFSRRRLGGCCLGFSRSTQGDTAVSLAFGINIQGPPSAKRALRDARFCS
ncbi:unnamed protein product [Lampetra planeri]